jgi:pectin methylesterase-like acyl-CoA thioesterase
MKKHFDSLLQAFVKHGHVMEDLPDIAMLVTNSALKPGVNNDSSQGYFAGCSWICTDGTQYTCVNAALGAAIWKEVQFVNL